METYCATEGNVNLRIFDVMPQFAENSTIVQGQGYQLFSSVELITPKMASDLLDTQVNNRKLSTRRSQEYCRRMRDQEWRLSDALKFDVDGHLIDGQHRLNAVIKTELAQPFIILAGFPRKSQTVLDQGMNRGVAAAAQLAGVDVTGKDLAVFRAMFYMSPTVHYRSIQSALSSPQFFMERVKHCIDGIKFCQKNYGSDSLRFMPIRAIVARAWYHENHNDLLRFIEVLDTRIAKEDHEVSAVKLRNLYDKEKRHEGGAEFRILFSRRAVSVLTAFLDKRPLTTIKETKSTKWQVPGIDYIPADS